ncbi:MAG: HAD family phosphatase [Clostridia bacterium]|nr:HAD family phosphatase [Clostridia bacterium]
MGKFDGILICSDWDGTLYSGSEVPERAREAIGYFMSEGGKFAITSGRDSAYIKANEHYIKPNTYCICYGGSLIVDVDSGEVLRKGGLGEDVTDTVDKMLASDVEITRINAFTEDGIKHYTPAEYHEFGKDEIRALHNYKMTFNTADEAEGERLLKLTADFHSTEYVFARSFASYLELFNREYTKGKAARVLKDALGAGVLVGMGDYENDITLFSDCDISFAVANAADSLKQVATYVTEATVSDSAAAEIIERLEGLRLAGKI